MHAFAYGARRVKGHARAGFALLFALVVVATGVSAFGGGGIAPSDVGTNSTTYGGRAYGVSTSIPLIGDTTYADTGDLPADGGVLFADFTPVGDSVASATVFLSYTRGFLDAGRSEVSASDVSLLPGDPLEVVASFAYAGATATCGGASGTSEIPDLTVGGVAVPVTGEPNQVYSIPGVLTLVINEQIDGSNGGTYDMTVNALHLVLATGIEAVVSSARSVVTCGTGDGGGGGLGLFSLGAEGVSPTSGITPMHIPSHDFMTGGGFFFAQDGQATCDGVPFSGDRINFGFNAGPRPGTWPDVKGHLNLVDHGPNCEHHLEGTDVTDYFPWPPDDEQHCRRWAGDATLDGVPGFHYAAVTCDYGEPGRDDRFAVGVWTSTDESQSPVYFVDNFDGSPPPEGGNLPGGNIQLHVFG